MTDSVTPPRPVPEITALNRPFWDAAAEHKLVIQQCPALRAIPARASSPLSGVR